MPTHDLMTWGVVAIFILVYAGMILGGLPRLKLDRSGVALLGAQGVPVTLLTMAVVWTWLRWSVT